MVSTSAPDAGRQVRDDLAVRPRLRLQVVERACRSSRARTARGCGRAPCPAWMFVRRRCSSYSVSTPSRPGSSSYCATRPAPPPLALRDLPERDEELLDLGGRLGAVAALGGEDAPVELDGPEQQIERRAASSSMRPRRRSSSTSSSSCDRPAMRVAPKSPESPFSVCTARKTSLMSSGSRSPALQRLVEREQIAPEAVDELLRLAERTRRAPCLHRRRVRRPRPWPTDRRPAARSIGPLARATEQLAARLAELLGRERLCEVGVRRRARARAPRRARRAASR